MIDLDRETNEWWLKDLLTQIFAFPPAARVDGRGYWIVGPDVINTLRRVKNLNGYFIWLPPVDFKGDGYMLEYPVEIRDDAVGATFTVRR